jgi:microcystin-dependent protein
MAEITSFTAERIQAIEDSEIVSGGIDGQGHLMLDKKDDSQIDCGLISGTGGGVPSGSVVMFASSVVPNGWLLCNGQAVSRSIYAGLFGTIGTTYGSGDGSSTFNVPNFEAKFPRMQAASLGGSAGTASHSHTIASHTHTITPHTHVVDDHTHSGGSHTHTYSGGAAHAHGLSSAGYAKVWIVTGAITMQMDRISVPAWSGNMQTGGMGGAGGGTSGGYGAALGGDTDSGGGSGGGSTGSAAGSIGNASLAPDTAALTPANTALGADVTSTIPPYLNVNFIIKT